MLPNDIKEIKKILVDVISSVILHGGMGVFAIEYLQKKKYSQYARELYSVLDKNDKQIDVTLLSDHDVKSSVLLVGFFRHSA
jgi:hypothetical protein